ncbi:MAG: hypothetical protein HQL69_21685 [Magnetococcales bacterium]|nr:hypothetical protein [Magnetococcales bacterium]
MIMDYFSDGALSIRLVNGMVRMEFVTASVGKSDAQGNPVVEPKFCIVMTPHGFMKTFGNMEKMLHSLSEAGVIKSRNQGQEEKRKGPSRSQGTVIEEQDRRSERSDRRKNSYKVVGGDG